MPDELSRGHKQDLTPTHLIACSFYPVISGQAGIDGLIETGKEVLMYANNEILFPTYAITTLGKLRGEKWQALVTRVARHNEQHEEALAFVMMMVRLNGCLACETDSFRAMRGCAACAVQTLRRFKGSDDDLMLLFEQALAEVRQFAAANPRYPIYHTT